MKKQVLCMLAISWAVACRGTSGDVVERLHRDQAKELKNPLRYTAASLKRGRTAFNQHCASCHDRDGRARSAVLARAADLTSPSSWRYGISDGEIFRTIREGAGNNMPSFKYSITREKTLWDIVNFVHSLRSESRDLED